MTVANTIEFTADISSGTFGTLPDLVTQGDTILLTANITLDGTPLDLTDVTTASLVTTRLDREVVVDLGEVVGASQVVFKLSRRATDVSGSVKVVIQLYDALDNRVSTIRGTIVVERDNTSDYVPFDSEKTIIEEVLQDGPTVIEAAQVATIGAIEAANSVEDVKTATESERLATEAVKDATELVRIATEEERLASTQATNNTIAATELTELATLNADVKAGLAQDAADEVAVRMTELEGVDAVQFDGRVNLLADQLADTDEEAKRPFLNQPFNKTMVSFMYDDGNKNVMTTIKPTFEAEGVPCNICVITSTLNDPLYINIQEAKSLKEMGWTVASHTHTHIDLQSATLADAEQDISTAKQILKENGLDHDILVYPYGAYSNALLSVVRKYNKLAIQTPPNKYNVTPVDTFTLNRISGLGEPGQTLQTVKQAIDDAPVGSWVIVMGHTGYGAYDDPAILSDVTALIQYVKSKNIDIVNIEDGWKRIGNIVDVGSGHNNLKIGVNGRVRMNNTFEDYSFDNSTPVTYFPLGESITFFNNNQILGKGFPVGDNGGTVTTFRMRMDKYVSEDASYQTFQPYYENTLYRRRWIAGTSVWGAWEKISAKIEGTFHAVVSTLNAYTASQVITSYPTNSITTYRVNSAGATGFPVNQAGTVTTYRLGGNGYDRQEFRTYNSDDIYLRHTDSSGAWTAWELLSKYGISAGFNAYTGTMPITSFTQNKVTVFRSDVGTPNSIRGVFTTHRIGGSGDAYQTFKEYNTFNMYVRYATLPSGDWSAWKQVQLN